MGKIPLYEQGQLPSTRVGIVGADRTGDIISGMGQDAATLTQQLIAVQKAKNEVADNIETEKYRIQFENDYAKKLDESKQKNIDNPYAVSDGAYDMGAKLSNDMAQGIANTRVRDKFLTKIQSSISSEQSKVRDWASKTTSDNAYANLGTALDGLEAQAGTLTDPSQLQGLVESAQKLSINSAAVVGAERANKVFEVAKKSIFEQFAYAHIDNNPEAVKAYIDKGLFNGVLDEKEQHELKSSADSIIKKHERERKEQLSLQNSKIVNDLFDKSITGKVSLQELNKTIQMFRANGADESDIKSIMVIKHSYINEQEQDAKANAREYRAIQRENDREKKAILREQKAEDHRLTSISTMMDLNKDYDKLFNSKGMAYGDDSIKDIKALQNKTITAYKKGLITEGVAKKQLQASQKGMGALIKAPVKTGWFNAPIDDYNAGRKAIKDYADRNFTDPKLKDAFYSDAMENYMSGFDRESKKKGFKVGSYTNHLINVVAPDYGKSTQVRKK